ncbi:MAG: hypothetical protein WBW33_26260 [Bryobacteraceae bacterium]
MALPDRIVVDSKIWRRCEGQLVFHRGLPAGSGVVLFRITPQSPEEAADIAMVPLEAQPDLEGSFRVITRDRIRVRPLSPGLSDRG